MHRGEREASALAEDHLLRWRPKTPVGGEATEVH